MSGMLNLPVLADSGECWQGHPDFGPAPGGVMVKASAVLGSLKYHQEQRRRPGHHGDIPLPGGSEDPRDCPWHSFTVVRWGRC